MIRYNSKFFSFIVVIILFGCLDIAESFTTNESLEMSRSLAVSHKMRLIYRIDELLKNPEFLKAAPEYSELSRFRKEMILYGMEHDLTKLNLPKNHPIHVALEKSVGVNWRLLDDADPLKNELRQNFKNLTEIDGKYEKLRAKEIFHRNDSVRQKAEEFLKMLDYDDVPKGRVVEFGKEKKLELASQWVKKVGANEGFSPEQIKRMVKLGEVLESPEFPYSRKISKITFKSLKNSEFNTLAKNFYESEFKARLPQSSLNKSKISKIISSSEFEKSATSVTAKSGRALSVAGKIFSFANKAITPSILAWEAYSVVKNPDKNLVEDISELAFFKATSPSCKKYLCQKLIKECGYKEESEVNWDKCAEVFYSKSLKEQDIYLTDSELREFFISRGPLISQVSCYPTGNGASRVVDFEIEFNNNKNHLLTRQSQSVAYSKDQAKKVTIHDKVIPELTDTILFNNGQPTLVQSCLKNINCTNQTADSVIQLGIRSPKTYRVLSFLDKQKDNLKSCCNDNKCQQYFAIKSQGTSQLKTIPKEKLLTLK